MKVERITETTQEYWYNIEGKLIKMVTTTKNMEEEV
jgi:hypothetical protein